MVKSAYSFATKKEKIERHIIVLWVDNEAGVLARVVGLFSGRGYNIDSLAVAEVDKKKNLSRITIATSGTPQVLQQIKLQLRKLVPVHKVSVIHLEACPLVWTWLPAQHRYLVGLPEPDAGHTAVR